ncbi:MAG: acyl carrier protein [Myxococcota bacterium]|jgi:acyl carrier protein
MDDTKILSLVSEALESVAPGRSTELHKVGLSGKVSDLGIDSVATMEMVGAIEDKLGCTFPDEELVAVNSLQDLAGMIRRNNE